MTYQTYKAVFKGYIDEGVSLTADEVMISDTPAFTGLIDKNGDPIIRIKQPVGFRLNKDDL